MKQYEFIYMQVRQAPLYGIDGVFETLDNWNDGTTGGLDVYEPGFQVGMFSEPKNVLSQGASRPMERTQIRGAVDHPKGIEDTNFVLLLPHPQVV